MTYIVAITNLLEGTNKLFCINSKDLIKDDQVTAVKAALVEHCPEEYRDDAYLTWVEELGETVEDVAKGAVQGELLISNVVKIGI